MLSTGQQTISHTAMAAIRSRAPIFVPLLVIALLLCHGALGNMDQPVLEPTQSAAVHQIQGDTGGPIPADEHPIGHSPTHSYYAVAFLTIFVGGLLGLLFGGVLPTRRIVIAPRQTRYDLVPDISYPSPRPTPTLLQVFRL